MSSDIWLILTEDAGPYNPIRHLFPCDRIPVKAPFPTASAGPEQEPGFVIDPGRLSEIQKTALRDMLLQKYAETGLTLKQAEKELRFGLLISHKWRLRIEGDELFNSDLEAQQWGYEFLQLSNEPSIDFRISPLAGWCLIAQLQLASRHPQNTGPTVQLARNIADEIAQQLHLSEVGQRFLEKGWNPELDIEVMDAEIVNE